MTAPRWDLRIGGPGGHVEEVWDRPGATAELAARSWALSQSVDGRLAPGWTILGVRPSRGRPEVIEAGAVIEAGQ